MTCSGRIAGVGGGQTCFAAEIEQLGVEGDVGLMPTASMRRDSELGAEPLMASTSALVNFTLSNRSTI